MSRWTGFPNSFTHLHTGLPADDPRIVPTAVLADATNFGLTRIAEDCSVASYRQLAWNAGWHLREDTYRQALAFLVNAQQRQLVAALFGAADVSSSDGRGVPDRRAAKLWARIRTAWRRAIGLAARVVTALANGASFGIASVVAAGIAPQAARCGRLHSCSPA